MKEKTETFNQGKRYFFYILMFAILGWFIFMQIFGASSDTELFKNHRSTICFQGHRIATCLYHTPMGSRV